MKATLILAALTVGGPAAVAPSQPEVTMEDLAPQCVLPLTETSAALHGMLTEDGHVLVAYGRVMVAGNEQGLTVYIRPIDGNIVILRNSPIDGSSCLVGRGYDAEIM